MLTGIDHVVIVVNDLLAATRDFTTAGFTVTPGGTHADGVTHNALISFADGSYLELLAFTEPTQQVNHPWYPRLAEGDGIEDFCLASSDLATDTARWRDAGLATQGPNDGGRQRPDGQTLRWRTTRLRQPERDATLPFVIEDSTPRDLRVPGGAATQHALPITRLVGVTIAVREIGQARHDYTDLLGASATEADDRYARFWLGDRWIDLVAPIQSDDAVAEHLQRHGAGPFAITLAGATQAPAAGPTQLDPQLTHGAVIRLGE